MLNNLNNKMVYHLPSDSDEYINDFLYNALSHSTNYDRASAYFSKESLYDISKGLENFIFNNGEKIRFVFSHKINKEDFEIIKRGYLERGSGLIEEEWKNNFTEEDKKNLSDIFFLISKGIADVKICFSTIEHGIFHNKFGIFKDKENNMIMFTGSNNETYNANHYNIETLNVFDSNKDLERIKIHEEIFNKWWDGTDANSITIDIPDLVLTEMDHYSKNNQNIFSNIIILDYNERSIIKKFSNKFFHGYTFDTKIKNYIEFEKNDVLFLKNNLTKDDLLYIMQLFNEMAKDMECNAYVSQNFNSFIESISLYINERKKIGIDIKSKKHLNTEEFEKFKNIVKSKIKRDIYENQLDDMYFMTLQKRSSNFSVPGTGKTTIVYGAYSYLKEIGKIDKILVVGPLNCFKSWIDEFIENFGYTPRVWRSDRISDDILTLKSWWKQYDLILINFESSQKYADDISKMNNEKTFFVVDEYHRIKRIKGKYAEGTINLSSNSSYRACLTGTPIPNGMQDIYNLMKILYSEELTSFGKFSREHTYHNMNESDRNLFLEEFYPFFVRTTKRDLGIPEPNDDIIIDINATPEETNLFIHLCKKIKNPLVRFVRVMQCLSSPLEIFKKIENTIDFDDNFYGIFDNYNDLSDKYDPNKDNTLKNLVSKIKTPTEKTKKVIFTIKQILAKYKNCIVWSSFNSSIHNLKNYLDNEGISCEIINGSVDQLDREDIIEKFKSKRFKVLLTNPQTLAESVSLHKVCVNSVYIDYSYNLVHYLQSKDRIHRLGISPDTKVNYYFMNTIYNTGHGRFSLERIIYRRLKEKEELMNSIIENKNLYIDQNLLSFSEEELEKIFDDIKLSF